MVKDPFRKWDRVDTFCALLVDLGCYVWVKNLSVEFLQQEIILWSVAFNLMH